jgi:hypothetical protein
MPMADEDETISRSTADGNHCVLQRITPHVVVDQRIEKE